MLNELFQTVLGMSLAGGGVILAVLLARLILRGAPRAFSYALWAVVLARLLCPFTPESALSLVPSARLVETPGIAGTTAEILEISTGIPAVDDGLNGYLAVHPYRGYVPAEFAPDGPLPVVPQTGDGSDWRTVPALVWGVGAGCMLAYSAVSLLRLRRRLAGAVPLEGEPGVWLADRADTSFILGLFRPRIYLPSSLPETDRRYILLHERAHIRRFDHLTRALAWLALCLHWFNPLVWLAFRLAGRDMEISCDRAALERAEGDIRADYADVLLRLSARGRTAAGPLAFGAGDAKERIKGVLSYKKPARWVVLTALIAVVLVLAALVTDRPFAAPDSPFGDTYTVSGYIYIDPTVDAGAEEYTLTADGTVYAGESPETAVEPVSLGGSLDEYTNKDYWTGGRDLTARLRRNNHAAWRGLDVTDDSFWYILQQKDGTLYLAAGWHDHEANTDPASDDSYIYWIAKLTPSQNKQ